MNRTKQVIYNSFFGIISTFVSLFSNYLVRVFISRVLGEEIYGINSLFYSIVNTLLIFELGLSAAIVIFLYKPVVENDYEKIRSYMNFYKRIYRFFCLFLLTSGLFVCLFFIPFLVHSSLNVWHVRLCFMLYLFAIISKYFIGYKQSLLLAYQKNRISVSIISIVELIFSGIEILLLLYFKNYLLYLAVFVMQNIIANELCNIYINKKYPFVKEKEINQLSKEEKKEIVHVVKPMFVQRISNQINNSSSSIILSSIANVSLVGFYANYMIIVHAAQTVVSQISNSFTTSLGNYLADNDGKQQVDLVYNTSRLGIRTVAFTGTCLFLGVVDYIIKLLFGIEYVLNFETVFLMGIYLLLTLMSTVDMSVQNAIGLHKLDSKMMVIQTIVTIVLSFLLGYFFGLKGIIIGNIIPYLIFSYGNKNYVVKKHIINRNDKKIFLELFKESVCFIIGLLLLYFFKKMLPYFDMPILYEIIISFFVSILIGVLTILIFYFNSDETHNLLKSIKIFLNKKS